MNTRRTLLSTLIAGALGIGAAGSAQALTFYYQSGGGFVDGTASASFPLPINFSGFKTTLDARNNDLNPTNDVYSNLFWGTGQLPGFPQSGGVINQIPLGGPYPYPGIGADLTGSITVSGPRVDLGYLVHHNVPINEVFGPDGVTVSYNMWLYDNAAMTPGTEIFKWHGDFLVDYTETLNAAPCSPPNPKGSTCDDIFTYAPIAIDPTSFVYGGQTYNIDISGFWDAPAPGGALQGAYYSAEGGSSAGYVQMQIPEPGTIALMGLGLIGLSVAATRRRKQGDLVAA